MLFFGSGTINLKAQQKAQDTQEKKQKQDGLIVDWINDFQDCEDWRAVSTCPLAIPKRGRFPENQDLLMSRDKRERRGTAWRIQD